MEQDWGRNRWDAYEVESAPNRTLDCPGESEYVVVQDTSSYAKRFDMIARCTATEVLPPIIYTPDERKQLNVKGINTKMLVTYVQQILAQACGELDRYPLYLILDNATCHSKPQLLEAFHDNGCQSLVDICHSKSTWQLIISRMEGESS